LQNNVMDNKYINAITLPHSVAITIIKNSESNFIHYYICSSTFNYILAAPENTIGDQIDAASNSLKFYELRPNLFITTFQNILSIFLHSWDSYFFEKIKFSGKGYRITFRRRKKTIIFYFGHSHDTVIVFRNVKIKKPHKYKFIILKNCFIKTKALGVLITKIKPINVYTKRGIRKSRQKVYKRKSNKATF